MKYFDGVNDYVDLKYAALSNTFTLSAWVKATVPHEIDKEGTTGYPGISGQKFLIGCARGAGVDDAGMGVSVGTNGISVYELRPAYMPAVAVYSGNVETEWNHIAITYTNRQPRIYLNGVLVRTGLVSPRCAFKYSSRRKQKLSDIWPISRSGFRCKCLELCTHTTRYPGRDDE